MKKLLLFLLASLAANYSSFAQNTFPTPSGYTGIGTNGPRTPLEVAPPPNNSATPAGLFRLTGHQSWGSVLTLATDDPNGDDARMLFAYRGGAKRWALGGYSNATRFSIWEDAGDGLYGTDWGSERFTVLPGGNVGIGTGNPQAVLDIGKPLGSGELGSVLARLNEGSWQGSGTFIGVRGYDTQPSGGNTHDNVKSFAIEHSFYGLTNSSINFLRGIALTGGSITFNTDNNTEKMRILGNGNVAIGTTDAKGYKLAINGSAIAASMTVKLYGNWGDYVFKKNYHLAALSEVKMYVEKNHHLPEMPSAIEIQEKGINLGEMNKLLVKKVEELTLYLIEKDKELKKQTEINQKQEERLRKIEQKIK